MQHLPMDSPAAQQETRFALYNSLTLQRSSAEELQLQPSSVCFLKCRPLPTDHKQLTSVTGPIAIISSIKFIDDDVFGGFICCCSVQYMYCKIYLLVSGYRCKEERRLIGLKVKKRTQEYEFIVTYVDIQIQVFLSCGTKDTRPLSSICSVAQITPER